MDQTLHYIFSFPPPVVYAIFGAIFGAMVGGLGMLIVKKIKSKTKLKPMNKNLEEFFKEINKHAFIYLISLKENGDENTLYLEIEGMECKKDDDNKKDKYNIYQVSFDNYIGYNITTEYNALVDHKKDKYKGHPFCVYSKSNYLEYIKKTTWSEDNSKLKHYSFNCLSNLIDVVFIGEPNVEIRSYPLDSFEFYSK